jgi:hypothetical protein
MSIIDSYLTSFFVVIAAVIAALFLQFSPISLTGLDASDVGTKFLTLLFMALVIERSVEIYIKNRFGTKEAELQQPTRIAARAVKAHKDALEAASAAVLPAAANATETKAAVKAKYDQVASLQTKLDTARADLLTAKEDAEAGLQNLKSKKKRAATIAALFLSLAVAVVGLRVLAQLVPEQTVESVAAAVNGALQMQAFSAIDILITALLLSGGADGIHQLIKDFLSDADELTGSS